MIKINGKMIIILTFVKSIFGGHNGQDNLIASLKSQIEEQCGIARENADFLAEYETLLAQPRAAGDPDPLYPRFIEYEPSNPRIALERANERLSQLQTELKRAQERLQ